MAEQEQKKISPTTKKGIIGENAAADYLRSKGHTILDRNIRYGHHELDIISSYGRYICFTEVKTRTETKVTRESRFGTPSSAVTYEKQRNLIDAARKYLKEKNIHTVPRFDVIEVYLKRNSETPEIIRINHIEKAFIS